MQSSEPSRPAQGAPSRLSRLLDWGLIGTIIVLFGWLASQRLTGGAPKTVFREIDEAPDYFAAPWSLGPESAPYQLVVWTDYQCSACQAFEVELTDLRSGMGDSVRIVIRHAPATGVRPLAFDAAIAAECARQQERFPEMHALLFSRTLRDSISVGEYSHSAGVADIPRFTECMRSPSAAAIIDEELATSRGLRLDGTPSVLIGKRLYTGGMPVASLKKLLAAAH